MSIVRKIERYFFFRFSEWIFQIDFETVLKKETDILLRIRIYDAVKQFRKEKEDIFINNEEELPQHKNPLGYLADIYQNHPTFDKSRKNYEDKPQWKFRKYIIERFRQFAYGRREDIYSFFFFFTYAGCF